MARNSFFLKRLVIPTELKHSLCVHVVSALPREASWLITFPHLPPGKRQVNTVQRVREKKKEKSILTNCCHGNSNSIATDKQLKMWPSRMNLMLHPFPHSSPLFYSLTPFSILPVLLMLLFSRTPQELRGIYMKCLPESSYSWKPLQKGKKKHSRLQEAQKTGSATPFSLLCFISAALSTCSVQLFKAP